MKKLTLFTIILSILLILPHVLKAQAYMAKEGQAEFISNAPLLEFKGTSDHLNGLINLDKNLVDFYLDLTTLDTGIDLRNQHMRDSYLETSKYPFAEFTGKMISSFDPDLKRKQDVKVRGDFTVHGVERDITITGSIKPTEEGLQLEASWTLLLEDYNIERPGVVFYELADEQKINISILLKPKKET